MRFSSPRLVCLAAVLGGLALWATPARGDDIYVLARTKTDGIITKISSSGAVSTLTTLPGVSWSMVIDSKQNLYLFNLQTNKQTPASGNATIDGIMQVTSTGTVNVLVPGYRKLARLALNSRDELFVADGKIVSKLNSTGKLETLANISFETCLAFDANDNLFAGSYTDGAIAEVALSNPSGPPTLSYLVSGGVGLPGPVKKISALIKSALGKNLSNSLGMAFGPDGNLYTSSTDIRNSLSVSGCIFKVTPDGSISKFADFGSVPITGVAFDSAGTLYASDDKNVYKVSPQGVLTTIYTSPIEIWDFAISPGLKLKPVKFVPPNDTWMYVGVAVLFWLLVAAWWWFSRRRTARRAKNLA